MAETDQTDDTAASPGQIIAPGDSVQPTPATVAPAVPKPAPSADVPGPTTQATTDTAGASEDGVNWTASEFVVHQKSASWYGGLALVAIILAALIYLVTRDLISTGVIIVGAIIFGTYAGRQPRQLEYTIDASGLTIGQKHYNYQSFRSFSVVPEGAFSSIIFMPLRRFAPMISIYYAPEHEDQIIGLLGDRLPFEEYQHDLVDRLMKRIRF